MVNYTLAHNKETLLSALAAQPGAVAHVVYWTQFTKNERVIDIPKYGVFEGGHPEFIAWYSECLAKKQPMKGTCEMIPANDLCHLYVDFDRKGLEEPVFLHDPIQQFVTRVKQYLLQLEQVTEQWELQMAVADGSRWEFDADGNRTTYKFSAHCVVNNVVFDDIAQMKHFVEQINGLMDEEELKPIDGLDMGVYRTRGNGDSGPISLMRLPGAYKWTDPEKVALTIRQDLSLNIETVLWTHFLISVEAAEEAGVAVYDDSLVQPLYVQLNKTSKHYKNSRTRTAMRNPPTQVDDAVARWISQRVHNLRVTPQDNGYYYVHNDGQTRQCLVWDGVKASDATHTQNNASVFVNDKGYAYYQCLHPHCQKRKSRYLGNVKHRQSDDDTDIWKQSGVMVLTHNDDCSRVLPFKPAAGISCYIVRAGMGMGKTHQLHIFLQQQQPKSVIVITNRVTLANTLVERLKLPGKPFKHYSDGVDAERLVVQYESLHRITRHYQLVIIDEIRSVCSNVGSITTNGYNLRANAQMFKLLITNAPLTILMDADLEVDNCVHDLVTDLLPPCVIQLERYLGCVLKRDMLVYDDHIQWLGDLTRDILQHKKIGVCCRATTAVDLVKHLCAKHNVTCATYTGDSSDLDKKDWATPNKWLQNVQVVAFTSTVTVGADVTLLYHRIYMAASAVGGCTPRELMQMTGRFRNVTDNTIRVCLQKKQLQEHLSQFDDLMQHTFQRQRALAQVSFVPQFIEDGLVEWVPAWFTRTYVYCRDEQSASQFGFRLLHLLQLKGGVAYFIHSSNLSADPIAHQLDQNTQLAASTNTVLPMVDKVTDERRKLDVLHVKQAFDAIANNTFDTIVDECKKRMLAHNSLAGDRHTLTVHAVLQRYPPATIDNYSLFNIADTMRHAITRYALATRFSRSQLENADWVRAKKLRWFELQLVPLATIIDCFADIATMLGVTSVFECDEWFLKELLVQYADDICNLCMRISALRNSKSDVDTSTSNQPWMIAKHKLAAEIKSVFGGTLECRRVQIDKHRTIQYSVVYQSELTTLAAMMRFE